jgi:hypothetical protein
VHTRARDAGGDDRWIEAADGSLRWRQSAGEVTVILLSVPADVPARRIGVEFKPWGVVVAEKAAAGGTGATPSPPPPRVFWRAALHRMIVPSECAWSAGGGGGDDGFVLHLAKANVEVWARPAGGGAAAWWPQLLAGPDGAAATGVEWDAYDKDYSDLPPPAAALVAGEEARSAAERAVDGADRALRRALREEDAARKRARQAALHRLRWGTELGWAALACGGRAPWAGAKCVVGRAGKEN